MHLRSQLWHLSSARICQTLKPSPAHHRKETALTDTAETQGMLNAEDEPARQYSRLSKLLA